MSEQTSSPDAMPFSFDGDSVAKSVAGMLNEVAQCEGSPERFKCDYTPPTDEEVAECYRRNCTVQGMLRIRPEIDGAWPRVEIPVFHPYHGVFILGNRNGGYKRPAKAKLMVWHPCLVRKQGMWIIDRSYKPLFVNEQSLGNSGGREFGNIPWVEISFLAGETLSWKKKTITEQKVWDLAADLLLAQEVEPAIRKAIAAAKEADSGTGTKEDRAYVVAALHALSKKLSEFSRDFNVPLQSPEEMDSSQLLAFHLSQDALDVLSRVFVKRDFNALIEEVETGKGTRTKKKRDPAGTGEKPIPAPKILRSFGDRLLLSEDKALAEWERSDTFKTMALANDPEMDRPSNSNNQEDEKEKKEKYLIPSEFKIGTDLRQKGFPKLQHVADRLSHPRSVAITDVEIDKLWVNARYELLSCNRAVNLSDGNPQKITLTEDDDLDTRRLFTYGVFLAENVVNSILNGWFNDDGKLNPDYWKDLNATTIAEISAYVRGRILSPGKNKYVWLRPFTPRNGADAVSALTDLSRRMRGQQGLAQLPIDYRQNHPSFFQKICPVETPESEMIGMSLHLAAGAKVGSDGVLTGDKGSNGLGYAASLIPFYQHTDAARAMVGAKNYVQARPVDGAEPPLVQTGMEQRIEKTLQPLIQKGMIPSEAAFMHPGRNLLVAYMPYFGYNYNDAVVVKDELRNSMAFEKGGGVRANYNSDGNITYSEDKPESFPLELGDKLMGRHGNKGVVGALLPPDKMPRLPKDPRLGELSGRAVDIVLNPLGVISRMNLGQLLETHVGLLKKLGAENLPEDLGKPFATFDPEAIRKRLLAINAGGDPLIDSCGRMTLTIPDSLAADAKKVRTTSPVVVGMQYFVRLDHVPSEKANFRGSEPDAETYDLTTGQPLQGRDRGGGQGIGNMEFWALEAYGAETIIKRILTDRFKPMPPAGMDVEGETQSQTFRAVRAFFRVLGVAIEGPDENDRYRARWTKDEEILSNARELRYINNVPEWRKGYSGEFVCSHPKCELSIDSVGTLTDKSKKVGVCVEDLLREHKIDMSDCDYSRELLDGAPTDIVEGAATIQPDDPNHWILTVANEKFHVYKRTNKVHCISDVLKLPIACKENTVYVLEASVQELKEVKVPSFGGLSDPFVFPDSTFSWGFIHLPSPVSAEKVLGKWAAGRGDISVVPILPRRYRQNSWPEDGKTAPHAVTARYQTLAAAAINPNVTDAELAKAVKGLFTKIKEMLHGKDGLVRGKGFKRRLDNSGRFVIVPDPSLAWDECGLPVDFLKQMYPEDTVLAEMSAAPTEEDLAGYAPPPDRFVLVNRQPTLHRYNFKALRPVPLRNPGRSGKSQVLAVNPLVCASMGADYDGDEMAVYVLDPGEEDDARKMLPTARQNLLSLANGAPLAGFDQDMVLGTFLALQYSEGHLTRFFIKDVLYDDCDACRELIHHRWDAKTCEAMLRHLCKSHIDEHGSSSTKAVVSRIATWMTRSFNQATWAGASIGYFDLMACRPEGVETASQAGDDDDLGKRLDEHLDAILDARQLDAPGYHAAAMVRSKAKGDKQMVQVVARRGELLPGDVQFKADPQNFIFLESLLTGAASPRDAFYAAMNGRYSMALKKLGTQEAGALTNKLMMVCRPWRIQGEDCAQTQEGVVSDDDARRNEQGECANAEFSLCRRHYGSLPDGSSPPDGFPIGVIAAQTIGERGTQLSMKAAKTGDVRSGETALAQLLGEERRFLESPAFCRLLEEKESDFKDYFRSHFVVLQEAIQWATLDSCSHKLEEAVAAQKKGNLFNLLAAGYKWKELADMIESQASSPAGELSAAEIQRRGQYPLPDFLPAPSPVARILIGFAKNTLENPSDEGTSFNPEPRDYDKDDENGENTDNDFDSSSEDEEDEESKKADEDVTEEKGDKKEVDEGLDDPVEWRPGGLPTSRGRIALVMMQVGGERQCRPEIPDRGNWSADVSRLANHFATWAKTEKRLENADAVKPLFKTQKAMLAVILEAAGKVAKKKDEKPMTGFMKRAFIYWEDRVLPVSALVGKVAEP